VRGENRADFDLTTNAGASVFSNVSAGVDFSYLSSSAIYYQPWEFELNAQNEFSRKLTFLWGASYQLWSGYTTRAAIIQTPVSVTCPSGSTNCTAQFSSGAFPEFKARNLLVPEIGLKLGLGDDSLEFDYDYKDSIFANLPAGVGNYLDPPRHDFQLSFTHPTVSGVAWNIHGNLSRLTSQNVVKLDPDSIGGPGYSVDGWLYGGGFSVTVPFKD